MKREAKNYTLRWLCFSLGYESYEFQTIDGIETLVPTGLGAPFVEGYVYGRPNFPDGYYISTTKLRGVEIERETLTVITQNSRYSCSLAELCCEKENEEAVRRFLCDTLPEHQETLKKVTFVRGADCPFSNQNDALRALTPACVESICTTLAAQSSIPPRSYILCIDLQRTADAFYSGFFKKEADGTVSLLLKEPIYHCGMFQDSVLCRGDGDEEEGYDIRYFPQNDGIALYGSLYDELCEAQPSPIPYFVCNVGSAHITVDRADLAPMACYKVPDEIN